MTLHLAGAITVPEVQQSHNGKPQSNAEGKLRSRANLRPFGPGFDPRRNLKGRPRSFDEARELAQSLAHEQLTLKDGKTITVAEAVFRKLFTSKEPSALKIFLEYAFGPVPTKTEVSGPDGESLKPMVIQVITQVPAPERVN